MFQLSVRSVKKSGGRATVKLRDTIHTEVTESLTNGKDRGESINVIRGLSKTVCLLETYKRL